MEILRICAEGQLLIKYSIIEHLILLKYQIMMDIRGLPSMFYNIFDKNSASGGGAEDMLDQQ